MLANIFGLLSVSIFTRAVGASIFGYYALFLAFVEIIERVFNFQTWQALIKFSADSQANSRHDVVIMLLKYCFLVDFISLLLATFVA